ncbi:MAG: outer membrane beta-barrel protein, partial [Cyclobacteriaceae bacterium]
LTQLMAENLFFNQQNFLSDTLDQLSDQVNDGYGYGADFRYTEPVGNKGLLMGSYEYNFRHSENDKITNNYNEASNSYNLLDSTLSNNFASDYIRQSAGISFRFRERKISFFTGLDFQWAQLSNQQFFPATNQQQFNFQNLIPMVMLRYDLGNNKNLRLFYRPRTNEPSISQLQNVVDNTNPLQISMGNPDLNQEYTHNLFVRYAASNPERSSTFFAMLGGSVTQDNITNATLIAQKDTLLFNDFLLTRGSQFSQPVNLDGFWSLRSFMTYGVPFAPIKSNLNFNLSANYTATPGIVNGNKNLAKATLLGAGLVISSNISEKVDFTITSQSNYNIVLSSLQQQTNNNYFNQSTSFDLNLIFPWGIVLRSNLNHQLFRGLSDGFDQDFLLWNMSLGKKLFKNERGELALTIFDLLNQNTSINRIVTDAYLEDVRTNVLQQYVMLTFTYQIRSFREKGMRE